MNNRICPGRQKAIWCAKTDASGGRGCVRHFRGSDVSIRGRGNAYRTGSASAAVDAKSIAGKTLQ